MKYISSIALQSVTDALNFSTADCHIIGSCDLYTTKAAGADKKLYKDIEKTLESQHESLVQFSKSLSPPQIPQDSKQTKRHVPKSIMPEVDLSRDSPFGSLDKIGARRTFAYLIATLNASHPDYDFANTLRPTDFRKTSGARIKRVVDTTLQNLRPRRMMPIDNHHTKQSLNATAPTGVPPVPGRVWNEEMWQAVDQEMNMKHCEKYVWEPEDDPFIDENSLWSQHYLFFNKDKKRVCYLHFDAFSIISHSPLHTNLSGHMRSLQGASLNQGAAKRAPYWLGHDVTEDDMDDTWEEDDETASVAASSDGEYMDDVDDLREHIGDGHYSYIDEDLTRSTPRRPSETLADAMEL